MPTPKEKQIPTFIRINETIFVPETSDTKTSKIINSTENESQEQIQGNSLSKDENTQDQDSSKSVNDGTKQSGSQNNETDTMKQTANIAKDILTGQKNDSDTQKNISKKIEQKIVENGTAKDGTKSTSKVIGQADDDASDTSTKKDEFKDEQIQSNVQNNSSIHGSTQPMAIHNNKILIPLLTITNHNHKNGKLTEMENTTSKEVVKVSKCLSLYRPSINEGRQN